MIKTKSDRNRGLQLLYVLIISCAPKMVKPNTKLQADFLASYFSRDVHRTASNPILMKVHRIYFHGMNGFEHLVFLATNMLEILR